MTQLQEFIRTGDPWIDNGIVSLWSTLAARYGDKLRKKQTCEEIRSGRITASLSTDSLTLKGPTTEVRRLYNAALKHLTGEVWGKTKKGEEWWFGVAQFFFKQQNKPKRFLTTPDRLEKKGAKDKCDFCGRADLKVREARTSENPFIVKSDRMSSFYSQLKGSFRICPRCTFASWFAVPSTFFSKSENTLNAFFFETPDLIHLAKLEHKLGQHRATGEPYRNFNGALFYTKQPLENFFSFLLAIYKEMAINKKLTQDVTVHVFSSRLDGKKVSFMRYYTVPNLPKILNFFSSTEWQSATKQHNAMEDVMKKFYLVHGGERNTVIREELARRFLGSLEVADLMEEFLFTHVFSEKTALSMFEVISLYKLTEKYYREVLLLDSRLLSVARNLGDLLGTVANENDDKSILYSLRGLRSLEDYYAYWHQLMTRYENSIRKNKGMRYSIDTITSEIDERNWSIHRSIVGIYAILKYSEHESKKKGEEA